MAFIRIIKIVSNTYTILVNILVLDIDKSPICRGKTSENIKYLIVTVLFLKTLHPVFKLLNRRFN